MNNQVLKILLPTDFSVLSLHAIKQIINNNPTKIFEFTLAHGYHLSDSLTTLLFHSKHKILQKLISEDFNNATEFLKSKYEKQFKSISYELLTSRNKSYIQNYLKNRNFDHIYLLNGFDWKFNLNISYDISEALTNSHIPTSIIDLQFTEEHQLYANNNVVDIFLI